MDDPAERPPGWPAHLRPGSLRWTRFSGRYEDAVAFYRDVLGLPVLEDFAGSFGEDGTIVGLPDATMQLEIVHAHEVLAADASDQLVFYLDDAEAVVLAVARLRSQGLEPDPQPLPYWAANGAAAFRDPDGRSVVFAPWVYGRDPQPIDRVERKEDEPPAELAVDVALYTGDRDDLRALFEEAEDSAEVLDTYIGSGRVLVARLDERVLGHLQLVATRDADTTELKNMAVDPAWRGTGVGRSLVESALELVRSEGGGRMAVATAAADTGNLRFYQRCGFRLESVERDAFTRRTGYPDPIVIDGIPLRDRVWLSLELEPR